MVLESREEGECERVLGGAGEEDECERVLDCAGEVKRFSSEVLWHGIIAYFTNNPSRGSDVLHKLLRTLRFHLKLLVSKD